MSRVANVSSDKCLELEFIQDGECLGWQMFLKAIVLGSKCLVWEMSRVADVSGGKCLGW